MTIAILTALFLLALVFLYLPYRKDIRAAYQRLENIEHQTLQTACGPVAVAIRGEGRTRSGQPRHCRGIRPGLGAG